jgi:ferredoxin
MSTVESPLSPAPPGYVGRVTDTGASFRALTNQSLFQSMSESGIAWPVSCRNGTCRTCLARLTEGQVVYDIAWPGLSAEEKRDGYCLPCIARPVGPVALTRA